MTDLQWTALGASALAGALILSTAWCVLLTLAGL